MLLGEAEARDLVETSAGNFRRHIEGGAGRGLGCRGGCGRGNRRSRSGRCAAGSNSTLRLEAPVEAGRDIGVEPDPQNPLAFRIGVGVHMLRRALVAGRAAEGGVERRRGVGEADHGHRQRHAADAHQAIVARRAAPDRHRRAVVIAGSRHAKLPCPAIAGAWASSSPKMCGGVSNVWNGAGDGTVHSSVVAPGPHGLVGGVRAWRRTPHR